MNTLSYNNPERAKERAKCVPPDAMEMEIAVAAMNELQYLSKNYDHVEHKILQRLLDDYENLRHFKDNAGGWQGLNALQVNYEIVKPYFCARCGSEMKVDCSKILTSMPPKRQLNCTNEDCKRVAYINL